MTHRPFNKKPRQSIIVLLGVAAVGLPGCRASISRSELPPIRPLGSVVDELHGQQERNADAAKFVIYMHEFEINSPLDSVADPANDIQSPPDFRGFRLTEAGEDHVRQIANELLRNFDNAEPDTQQPIVIIERSNTSKSLDSRHQYPVHGNAELDEIRRRMVITVFERMGLLGADEFVIVAPSFATGLNAAEASAAFQGTFRSGSRQSR